MIVLMYDACTADLRSESPDPEKSLEKLALRARDAPAAHNILHIYIYMQILDIEMSYFTRRLLRSV